MKNRLMMGLWRYMLGVPPFLWEKQIVKGKKRFAKHLAFMSEEHRLVHHFAVRELPRAERALSPQFVSNSLKIPMSRVTDILDELERRMTFIFRNAQREIEWAYPVTVERTPHHVAFHTGEQLYAA